MSFDLVIMNPPFTSNTKHYDARDGVLNAAFAAFDSSDEDQAEAMANRLKSLSKNTLLSWSRWSWFRICISRC